MTAPGMGQMPELLEQHFGKSSEESLSADWSELVKVVLIHGRSTSSDTRDWTWLARSDLGTADEAASAGTAVWETALESAGFTPNKAGLLVRLARWWGEEIGVNDPAAILTGKSLPGWQAQLRGIRGVSWELADRILVTLGANPVYPLDRGSRRIVLRHGWLDLSAEYDEWQSFFSRVARDGRVSLRWLWKRTSDVGRKFCGSQPKCEECPLRSLLPERGPVQFDGDG